jgi:hypothetical protein
MVWHQENGCWKIVQSHLSIGVGSDDYVGGRQAVAEQELLKEQDAVNPLAAAHGLRPSRRASYRI